MRELTGSQALLTGSRSCPSSFSFLGTGGGRVTKRR